ncbi:MAG: chorion class high-cysteine HCB protein 13 [Lachnospiraceae bacterium]|nr:chorion class high-cysteine HCB protein 13 [Lachnospiraceae bacterium]
MSDLTATNCGCNNNNGRGLFGNNSWLWIILLLSCFGNNDDGCGGGRSGFGLFNNDGNSCCNTIIWLLILTSCCGN